MRSDAGSRIRGSFDLYFDRADGISKLGVDHPEIVPRILIQTLTMLLVDLLGCCYAPPSKTNDLLLPKLQVGLPVDPHSLAAVSPEDCWPHDLDRIQHPS